MTKAEQVLLKKNLPAWVTFANFALLISFVWYQAQWQQSVDNQLEMFRVHTLNANMHMPYIEKVRQFVPRSEIEIKMLNIQQTLDEIKSDVKKLETN